MSGDARLRPSENVRGACVRALKCVADGSYVEAREVLQRACGAVVTGDDLLALESALAIGAYFRELELWEK